MVKSISKVNIFFVVMKCVPYYFTLFLNPGLYGINGRIFLRVTHK